MARKKPQTVDGSQNDSGVEDTVSTADFVRIKGQVEKIKQKRAAKRQAQKISMEEAAHALRDRIEEQRAVRAREIEMARSQRLANLTRAMEKRFELEKAIAAKLEESQREFSNLTNLVESVYAGRLEQLRQATLPARQATHDERMQQDS